MQTPSYTPAEQPSPAVTGVTFPPMDGEQAAPAVTPVTFKSEIAVSTRFGASFRFGCHLTASHPDMPLIEIDAGPFVFRGYPAPDQMRAMAAQMIKLADAAERAKNRAKDHKGTFTGAAS